METSAREVHENMNAVIDYQTHHRLRETQVRCDRHHKETNGKTIVCQPLKMHHHIETFFDNLGLLN